MHPAQRNKIDISVSMFLWPWASHLTEAVCTEIERAGTAALCQVRQAAYAQECAYEDAEGPPVPDSLFGNSLTAYQDRKYFDSGDYALSKAGVEPQNTVGTAIPNPEKCVDTIDYECISLVYLFHHSIPHASSPANGHGLSISPTHPTSPVNKESGLAHDEERHVQLDDHAIRAE
jgi:hypothetical protein